MLNLQDNRIQENHMYEQQQILDRLDSLCFCNQVTEDLKLLFILDTCILVNLISFIIDITNDII